MNNNHPQPFTEKEKPPTTAPLIVEIVPCMLGFAVSTYYGKGFKHERGIYRSFGQLALDLIFTEEPFAIRLR